MSNTENLLAQLIARIDPVATYYATDLDETGDPKYYGFATSSGNWYIMRLSNAGACRYTATSNDTTTPYATT